MTDPIGNIGFNADIRRTQCRFGPGITHHVEDPRAGYSYIVPEAPQARDARGSYTCGQDLECGFEEGWVDTSVVR